MAPIRGWLIACAALLLTNCFFLVSAGPAQNQDLDREYKQAASQYESGHLTEAAALLEKIVRRAPDSFEVQELLGMVYASQSQNGKANQCLATAVHLKPDSSAARTNLATNLIQLGKFDEAQGQLKKAVALEPQNYDANHDLGELYVQMGRLSDAVPLLKQAQKMNASAYDNGYDLALAYLLTGQPDPARQVLQSLLRTKNTAELHNLLGQIEEKDGKFLTAVNEFQIAAHQDPSESNLFDWGSELLLHRTLEPAIEVFRQSAQRYPNSPRVAIGLGIALYSRGNYDDAVKSLLHAADLSPSDPRCYLFLSKAYDSSPNQANEVVQRFRRFVELQPANARALYYYAMSLWKGKRTQDPTLDLHHIEALLQKAIALDPKLAEAHLQLGNLYSDQAQYGESIPEYLRALENNADLADAYYRLGQAYVHTGQKGKAQEKFQTYQQLRAQHMADLDKQIADVRQFVTSETAEKEDTQAKP
jgi:tetratricopeptide (TPR) repeat protein